MRRWEPCKSGVGLWQSLSHNRMLAWRHPRVAWWQAGRVGGWASWWQAGQVAEGHPWWQRWWHIRWKPLQRCWKFGFMMKFWFHSDLEGILQIIYLPLIGCPDDSLFSAEWLWCGKSGSDRSSDFGETCFYQLLLKGKKKNKDFHQVCWRQARVDVRRFLCLHPVQVVPDEWKQIKLSWDET